MTSDTLYARSPHVVWRRTLDAVLILGDGAGEPLNLAGSGPELWELLAVPTTIQDLTSTLAARHDVDVAVVAHDVDVVLERLVKLGVVEQAAP